MAYKIDSYDKLICNFNGADGATTYTAETGQTVTFVGTAQIDTAQSKFGGSSLLLDGNSDYVTVPNSTDWAFGTGDFTIDLWVKNTGASVSYDFVGRYGDTNNYWNFRIGNDNKIQFYGVISSSSIGNFVTQNAVISDTNWHHVAVVRNGSSCYIFVDGVSVPTTQTNSWGNIVDFTANLRIGYSGAYYLSGWADTIRISKGIARWTSSFNPPNREYGYVNKQRIWIF